MSQTSCATGEGGIMESDSVPVEFTLEEFWMLHDLVRHDQDAISEKKWPVVSTELNEQVALAIVACEDSKLKGYTLLLSAGDILLLDYVVRRDMKTPEGAKGKDILLKLFRARRDLAIGPVADTYNDTTYKAALDRKTVEAAGEVADEVIEEFSKEDQEDASTDTEPDDGADENAD